MWWEEPGLWFVTQWLCGSEGPWDECAHPGISPLVRVLGRMDMPWPWKAHPRLGT